MSSLNLKILHKHQQCSLPYSIKELCALPNIKVI